ncbi:MAG: hypothetical protein ACRD3J_14105 [Thermoanaerobaculia bacterium]
MTKKVSASQAVLPRRGRDELDEVFSSISPEAATFLSRNPVLKAKLVRAAERLEQAFPRHPLRLVLAVDHDSGDRDLFIEIARCAARFEDLFAFERQWIHDREDAEHEVNFGYFQQ